MLAERARLFAIDLPDFGASERRDDLLSPRAMGAFLAGLIGDADARRGDGGPLFAAADHPDRLSGLIVFAGGTAIPIQLGEPLASWVLDPTLRSTGRWIRG